MKYKVFCILLTLFILLVVANISSPMEKVFAAGGGDIGAYPTNYDPSNPKTKSWFIYELKPGETKEDSITVVNNSDQKVNVKIYAVDATTTSDGAFALLNENQRQSEVGSWVNISTDTVTVDPRSHVDVPFTISIPKFATVGDHAGGIIIQEADQGQNTQTQGMGLNIVSRVGTRIYESVPGSKVFSLDLQNIQYKIVDNHLVFSFTMINNGNTILTPNGTLVIKDFSGKTMDTVDLMNLGSVFPGKPITVMETSHIDAPWFGKYNVTVTVNYSPIKAIAKTVSFFIYVKDWRLALPIPVIVVVFVLFIILRKILHHGHKIEFSLEKAAPARQPLPARMDIGDDEEDTQKKVKNTSHKKKIIQASGVYTPAPVENVDALFISRHIKLLVILVSTSVLILSMLFAFILKDFVLSNINADAQIRSRIPTPVITQPVMISPPDALTPTGVPIDKAQIKVTVLNGTGVTGAAKSVADKLTAHGFTVVETGNAPEDAAQTVIMYPDGEIDGAEQLKRELSPAYTNIREIATASAVYTITLGQ